MVNDVGHKRFLDTGFSSRVEAQYELEKRMDPQVSERPVRRKFSIKYKLRRPKFASFAQYLLDGSMTPKKLKREFLNNILI